MTENKRGGAGRGQGRKALAGEVRMVRPFKATDAEWEDFKLVTPEKVRQWVARQAAKLRKAEEPNVRGNAHLTAAQEVEDEQK